MAWDALTTANVTVGKFLTTTIMTKIKDCLEYLYAFVGASGNLLNNGSFELDSDGDGDPDSWTIETYAGGSAALYTTAPAHGAQAMSFVHPGGASNGGGKATSDYIECSEYINYFLGFLSWATAAGMKNIVQVQYYTKAKVANGAAVTLYTSVANPATPTWHRVKFKPTANSRYVKIISIGGYTDTDVAGTAYFDGLAFGQEASVQGWIQFNGTGTIAIQDSFNVASITHNDTGDFTVTWDIDFANDNYACIATGGDTTDLLGWVICTIFSMAVGSVRIKTRNYLDDRDNPDIVCVAAFGDQ